MAHAANVERRSTADRGNGEVIARVRTTHPKVTPRSPQGHPKVTRWAEPIKKQELVGEPPYLEFAHNYARARYSKSGGQRTTRIHQVCKAGRFMRLAGLA